MREASRRTIQLCLGRLAATLLAVGSDAAATPMEAEPAPQEAALLESELELEAGAVSVVEEGIELPEAFRDLLRAPPPGAPVERPGAEAAAPPEVAVAPEQDDPAAEPQPMSEALVHHHLRLARLLAAKGDFEGAAGSAGRAIEIAPDAPEPRLELGFALLGLGRFAEAEAQLLRAQELGADSAALHAALARTASAQHRTREAIHQGREALRRDPDLVPAANNLAWLLATSEDAALRDPEESIRIARRALRSVGGANPRILDTLAAAYAAAGRYPDAVAAAERAEALARSQGNQDLAAEIHGHLERYRAGEAYTGS